MKICPEVMKAAQRLARLMDNQEHEVAVAGFDPPAFEVYCHLRNNFVEWIASHTTMLTSEQFRLFMVHVQQILEFLIDLKKLGVK